MGIMHPGVLAPNGRITDHETIALNQGHGATPSKLEMVNASLTIAALMAKDNPALQKFLNMIRDDVRGMIIK